MVLVIDARGMTRGIAPLILGYQAFDPNIRIAGVILNQLGGSRHEAKLRAVIQHYTGVPVLGAVQHDERMTIIERHLGLVPSNEAKSARNIERSMNKRSLTPFLTSVLWVQQAIITAMVASRMNPNEFEKNIAAVRSTMKLAAQSDLTSDQDKKESAKEFDQVLDLYIQMFRTGDVSADGDQLQARPNELN